MNIEKGKIHLQSKRNCNRFLPPYCQVVLYNRAYRNVVREKEELTMKAHALLAGRVYCAHCGNRLTLTTISHKCKNPDRNEGRVTRYRYQCHYGVRHPSDCDGQTVYTVDRLDSLMDQVIRDIFSQIKTVLEKDLISAQHQKDIDLARRKADKAMEAVKTAQKDHDDLKAETIKVIRGESKLDAELLTALVHEAQEKLASAQASYDKANEELNELIAGAQNGTVKFFL